MQVSEQPRASQGPAREDACDGAKDAHADLGPRSADLAEINAKLRRDAFFLGLGGPSTLVVGTIGLGMWLWASTPLPAMVVGVLAVSGGFAGSLALVALWRWAWMGPRQRRAVKTCGERDVSADLVYLQAARVRFGRGTHGARSEPGRETP